MKSRKLVKLSATAIDKLKPEATVYDRFDAEVNGLTVRVQPTGSKSYCVLYRHLLINLCIVGEETVKGTAIAPNPRAKNIFDQFLFSAVPK
jgi:hypothetical protein